MMQQTQPYEFNDEQNRLIGHLGARMTTVGGIQLLLGLLLLALAAMLILAWQNGHTMGPAAIPGWVPGAAVAIFAFLPLMIGGWVRSAGWSFKRVSESQNRDMWHLMNALGSLDSIFSLMSRLIWIIVFLALVLTVLAAAAAFGLLK
jgi:hypothetical protein